MLFPLVPLYSKRQGVTCHLHAKSHSRNTSWKIIWVEYTQKDLPHLLEPERGCYEVYYQSLYGNKPLTLELKEYLLIAFAKLYLWNGSQNGDRLVQINAFKN